MLVSTVHAARLLYGNMQRPAWAWTWTCTRTWTEQYPTHATVLMGFECIGRPWETRQGLIPHLQIMRHNKNPLKVLVRIKFYGIQEPSKRA